MSTSLTTVAPTTPAHGPATLLPLPAPQVEGGVRMRLATRDDIPFMDALQKRHSKQLGYFPTKQFEGYVEMGGVLIAEQRPERVEELGVEELSQKQMPDSGSGLNSSTPNSSTPSVPTTPLGYLISRDRYLKRDELGVIYQMCVAPGARRSLVAAALLREVFRRSAYGCRLYCCWCAQDLEANKFWEAMGFVPIAFRGGSSKKKRVHIFWQKKIVEGDTESKWWYPSKTDGGAIREDRLALPIPPGLHWSDPMPVLQVNEEPRAEPRASASGNRRTSKKIAAAPAVGSVVRIDEPAKKAAMQFGAPGAEPPVSSESTPAAIVELPKVKAKPKPKAAPIDPKVMAGARELRDRWLEQVNDDATLLLPEPKYEVMKPLAAMVPQPKQLEAIPHESEHRPKQLAA